MDNSKELDEPQEQGESGVDPTGAWPGKNIDWSTDVVEAKLHVELPFWIAAPDGTVSVNIGDCDLGIQFRNSVVGVYREGHFFRSERSLAQITAEGMPFSDDQKTELESLGEFGQRHFRTMLTLSVNVHESIYSLLDSDSQPVQEPYSTTHITDPPQPRHLHFDCELDTCCQNLAAEMIRFGSGQQQRKGNDC